MPVAFSREMTRVTYSHSPKPTPPDTAALSLLHKVWNNKELLPRVKTFAWRIIRRAIPTAERASRYSKHISNICCRCGL
jgi:hypothetical protein